MKNPFKRSKTIQPRDKLLPRFSLFIFDRSRTAAILWLCVTVFGVVSYTTLLQREGFPSINVPYSIITGTYLVNDASEVDAKVAKPISDIVLGDERVANIRTHNSYSIDDEQVTNVQTQSQDNFYSVSVQFKEGVDANAAGRDLDKAIKDSGVLPEQATAEVQTPKIGFTERGDDIVISVYAKDGTSTKQLTAEAQKVTDHLKKQDLPQIQSVSVIDPFAKGIDPATGQTVLSQKTFDRYAERHDGQNQFYNAVAIGIDQKDGTDVIELESKLQSTLADYNNANKNDDLHSTLSASYAHDIRDQIGELQKALLEGLLAVLIVGSIVIAIRASLITVLAMVTVLAITLGVLFAVGYSLNTITLFALILCLGLIVDDTIIMVEALDAERRRNKDARKTVEIATRKVSRAMVAATFTAALSFAPLLFVGGVLGGFIKAIPVTVITSLLVSLVVALVFIPLFARYLLLGKKQMGKGATHEVAAGFEAKIAQFIGKPMLWARDSKKKLLTVGIIAIFIGSGFIGAGGYLFQKVTFNIFPPSKDTNGLTVQLRFAPGTTIVNAQSIADRADQVVSNTLDQNFDQASYYTNANAQSAMLTINLISYKERDVTSPTLQKNLQNEFDDFTGATVKVSQLDVGPPVSAFTVRINAENRTAAQRLAGDVEQFLRGKQLTRASGEQARITETAASNTGTYSRDNGMPYLDVTANFDATDTSTLVLLAQQAVEKEFTAKKIQGYGLESKDLTFELGQEEENQDSFQGLIMAFPILLIAIYLLLSVQFRSLLQPLLIFTALPFSLFGITLGLYLTNNAFSFFAMLGFFALIGLSIKNTILLTDYANQLRREGAHPVDAAVGALAERFRPLIATSLTAVVSLIPLAIASPFWEGLAVVLIAGLLSSTFLVITVFPYYYLGAEFLRLHISRKITLLWLGLSVGVSVGLSAAGAGAIIPLVPVILAIMMAVISRVRRKK